MKHLLVLPVAALLIGCLPVQQPKQIIVDGEASLTFAPEVFYLNAEIRSRGAEQQEVLANISEMLATIQQTLPELDGLTKLKLDAQNVRVSPVYDPVCVNSDAYYRAPNACSVTGYLGEIKLAVTAAPADRAGQALSLLSELGAEGVSLSGYALSDMDVAQNKVIDAAVRDASTKADGLAAAAGAMVTGPLRIQFGDGFADQYGGRSDVMMEMQSDMVVVSSPRSVSPQTDLSIEPQPITVNAKIIAAFEIQ